MNTSVYLLEAKLNKKNSMTTLEICAGAGGQAVGLEKAGFDHAGAIEIEKIACETLRQNRPKWNVLETDVRKVDGKKFRGIDLLAGGVPCPPFSIAGKQLGPSDERDLFPEALRLIEEAKPRAVMLENVRGLASPKFQEYRKKIISRLVKLGYEVRWAVLNASDFGVPQLRPRFILAALRSEDFPFFAWPSLKIKPHTVGAALGDQMASRGWKGAFKWVQKANDIAPTLVGGSKKHGGPDLGPTRAREKWAELGVDGIGVADQPPGPDFPVNAKPKITVRMAARLQGFPDDWHFAGKKTAAYRQVGNAFPPPVAAAVGEAISSAFKHQNLSKDQKDLLVNL